MEKLRLWGIEGGSVANGMGQVKGIGWCRAVS